jgi:hypothetical protein
VAPGGERLRDGDGLADQLLGPAEVGVEGPPALFDQPLAERPGVKRRIGAEEGAPLVRGQVPQALDQEREPLPLPRDLLDVAGQTGAQAAESLAVVGRGGPRGPWPAALPELSDLVAAGLPGGEQLADDPAVLCGAQLSAEEPCVVVGNMHRRHFSRKEPRENDTQAARSAGGRIRRAGRNEDPGGCAPA